MSAVLAPSVAVRKPTVRTFDVFDTLIARKCIEPVRIFVEVEQRLGIAGFAADRVAAERQLALAGAYTLEAIYDMLAVKRQWTTAQRLDVQRAEIEAELDNVVPIGENLSLVRHGDLLVSDMYLDRETILAMVRKAGLDKQVALVLTCDGKKSGRIWRQLLQRFEIEVHTGDNLEADVVRAREHHIRADHFLSSSPDFVESWLIGAGARDLAEVSRMARLASWTTDPVLRELQLLQLRLNFPILVLSTVLLLRHVRQNAIENILFCSRDCNLWLELFKVFARHLRLDVDACYFHTSREARVRPSGDYLRYVRQSLGQRKSLVVDICGTGWSLSHLFDDFVQRPQVYLLHKLNPSAYAQFASAANVEAPFGIIDNRDGPLTHNNTLLEMLNYAEHPQVLDVLYEEGHPVPLFKPDRQPAQVQGYIDAQRQMFLAAVEQLDGRFLHETLEMPDAKLVAMISELYKHLNSSAILRTVYAAHGRDEQKTLESLQQKLG